MKLRKILARIQQGDRTFFTADGYFQSVSVSLGEGDRSSTCSYTISDPKLKVGQSLFAMSFDNGGIEVPPDLLAAPEPPPAAGDETGQVFEDLGDLPGDGQLIINECGSQGIRDIPSLAYIMATVQRETGSYKPVEEIGGSSRSYAPYYGRGYVQLTHLTNYQKYSTITGKDLVNNKELALEPQTAAFILAHGFLNGTFTGAKLRDYISADGSKKDYMNARRIINGTDKAALIAGYAQEWETKLSGLTVKKEETPTEPTAAPAVSPPPPALAQGPQGALADKADSAPTEISEKGTEIIVSLGESFDNLLDFHFIHTGTAVSVRPSSVTLKGQCIRWLLARRKQNTTYKDITLRELAQIVADKHGLVLEMEGDGPKYAHLDQTGLSDFGLLHREATAVGFYMSDGADNVLRLGPLRPNFTGFVIEPWMILDASLNFNDEASGDMPANRTPDGGGTDAKAEINPATGAIAQVRVEDSRGAMGSPSTGNTEGAPARATAVTGNAKPKIYGTIAVSDAEAGLPTQETGAIALANGVEVTAESLKEELQRVQGYASSVKLKMTEATLSIVPGNIIALSPACAGGVFAREWRVSTVQHEVAADAVPSTSLGFYTPQGGIPKPVESTAGGSGGAAASPEAGASLNAAGYIKPSNGEFTSGFMTKARPRHFGIDLATPGIGGPVWASKDGTVEVPARDPDGYGLWCIVSHGDGWETLYGHFDSLSVRNGQTVKQGEKLGGQGSSGRSTGPHVHFGISQNGAWKNPADFFDPGPYLGRP